MDAPPVDALGPYTIGPEVERTAGSVIYRGVDRRTDEPVALELFLAGVEGPRLRRAFLDARRRVQALPGHPYLARVLEVGEVQEAPWAAWEPAAAGWPDLAEALRTGLPREAGLEVLAMTARAVGAAHARGVSDGRLEPTAVLLPPCDAPVVRLGWSLRIEHGGCLDGPGVVLGAPHYTSPESVRGRREPTPTDDVWALGVMLYEHLAGRRPFEGDTMIAVLRAILDGEVVPPSRRLAGVPASLDAIVLGALERDPARRTPDAGALAEQLVRWMFRQPEPPLAAEPAVGLGGLLARALGL